MPHPDSDAIDDLEASIAAGRLPVKDECIFD